MSADKPDGRDHRDDDQNDDRDHHWHDRHDDDGGRVALVTAITALSADTGASSSDFITSVALQTVTGTFSGTLQRGDAIQVSADGGTSWITATVAGSTWSAAGVTLAAGTGSLVTRTLDSSGHTLAGASHSYVLDTVAPLAPNLVATFVDSGASTTDGITNATTATLSGMAEAGATVKVYDGTSLIATVAANATAGSWSYIAAGLANGAHNFAATATDVAGNVSASSAASTMTVDTVAATPVVTLANDSGSSNSDHISSNGTLALSGIEPGATVQYSINNGTTWTSSFSAHEGSNSVLVRQIDVAGNISDAAELSFTLDTTAPVAPSLNASFVDSGTNHSDTITNATTATLSGKVESGATVTVYDGATPIATVVANPGGVWKYSATGLSDGLHSFTITQTDLAGNVSAPSAASAMTVDTVAAAPGVALANDTGIVGDNITSNGALALSGVEPGATVQYSIDGKHWTSSFSAHEGANGVQVRQIDLAGNTSAATALNFTLDTTAPAAPTVALQHDTSAGADNSDHVTSNDALQGAALAGATAQVYEGNTLLGTTTVNNQGAWTLNPVLSDGSHTLTVRATDIAGNISAPASLTFTLDTAAAAPVVALANDTGIVGDNITSNGSPAVTGLENGATVQYSTNGGSTWTSSFAPVEGSNSVEVRQVDVAGNISAATTLAFTLDTHIAPPTINGVADNGGMIIGYGTAEPGSAVTVHYGTSTGTTTADGSGAWTFSFANSPSSFTATAVDVAGNSSIASPSFTVTNVSVNHPPTLDPVPAATFTDTPNLDTFTAVTGQLTGQDPDSGTTLSYGVSGGVASTALSGYNLADTGAYGTVYVNSTSGAYTYVPNNAAINALPGGANPNDVFYLTVSDGVGGTANTPLTISLIGANDTPTLTASLTAASYADTAAANVFTAVTGQLAGHDVDTGTTLTYGVSGGAAATPLLGYDVAEAGSYGTVYLNSASGAYTYVPNNAAINALPGGASTGDNFTLSVSDGTVTTSQPLTIGLTGANDNPVLAASLTTASFTDTSLADFFAPVTGSLTTIDPDAGAMHSYSVSGGVGPVVTLPPVYASDYDLAEAGAYGTVYLNSSTGAYTYVPNNAAINALPAGASAADNFTLTVSDGLGGTSDQPLAINLTGANDASVISGVLPFNYTVGTPAALVAPNFTLGDVDNNHVTSATVAISRGFSTGNDVLSFNSALLQPGMTASYGNNGVLTIAGSGTLANYQAILDSVTFQTTTAGGRTIGFTVFDGAVHSATVDTSNISLDSLSTTGFRLPGVSALDASGFSVSAAGDVNHDGYADFIIGAPWVVGTNGPLTGSSYLVYGKASGFTTDVGFGPELPLSSLSGSNGFSISGQNMYDRAGISVRTAGDVNGDGFSDVIIGAPYSNNNGVTYGTSQFGGAYVVFGHAANSVANLNVSSLDGTNGFGVIGAVAGNWAGYSVSGAGDVNGDGFADVIIGSPHAGSGAAYVVFGHASTLSPSLDLAHLTSTQGFAMIGANAGDWTGASVSDAGDVNGDGIGDVIIGDATPNGISASATGYVVFGTTSGFGTSVNLGALNGTNGFSFSGAGTGPLSGVGRGHYAVHAAGDVNGDGFGDVIIGAAYASTTHGSTVAETGAAYVVFGHTGGFSTADPVTAISDGPGNVNLAHLTPTQGFEIIGAAAGDRAGYSVSAAGDVNGDGYGDLIIGAPNAKDNGGNPAGTSYVIFGKASGFGTVDPVTHMATVDLANLGGNDGFRISAVGPHNDSGYAVSAAGDVNGDGFADLIVGSSAASPHTGTYAGESYVIFGAKFITTSDTYMGSGLPGSPYTLQGTTANDSFIAGQGNATMIGGGGVDSFSGGVGDDTMHLGLAGQPSSAFLKIDGGGGFNTLVLDGSGMTLDLTSPGVDGRVHNIARIDLGSGNNSVALNIHDVLNMSDNSNQLFVTGQAGDSVSSVGQGWVPDSVHATVTDHGITYNSYTSGMANLLIDPAVTVHFI